MADQGVHLAAIGGDQVQHLGHPGDLLALAGLETAGQLGGQGRPVLRGAQPAEAVAHVRGAQLGPALGLQVLQGPDDAIAGLSQRPGGRAGIQRVPDPPLLCLGEQVGHELRPFALELAGDDLGRQGRLQLVAGIEGRALTEHARQLQVGEGGAQHQRPDVVPVRQLDQVQVELVAGAQELVQEVAQRLVVGVSP
jgi:hypothetical protein